MFGCLSAKRYVKKGDLAKIVNLPEYWGCNDIVGNIGIIIDLIQESNFCNMMLGSGETIVIATVYLEIVSSISDCKDLKKKIRSS